MDRYEVMAGKMAPLTDGAHRKWGFAGKVETRSYERLVDALIDFVETGDGLKARFLTGFAACLAADRKSVENQMKAVVCVETGKIYESIMSAGRDVERTDGAICQALRNESRTCAGYHWQYLDE